ncbi:MAG: 3-oxoacyl-ACP synthase [Spirochaetaceae bacterium]|jgi:3-oxoacyl-[acyl-carrier-protein] synthase-3|nr:3-oxoacyl-ACP synthase [Spirochaetaceae bacterium]
MELARCGIVGFGLYLPEPYRDFNELARLTGASPEVVRDKFGLEGLHYPGPDDHTSVMSIRAAEKCLENTGVDPLTIDLIIYYGETWGDYPVYSIGPAVQHAIGATNAWCYNIECRCGSAIPAMEQAKKYIQTEEGVKTVMVVGAYRNTDFVDYQNRGISFFYDLGSGGAAAIIQKDWPEREVLGCAEITDGSFHDALIVPGGGTRTPFTSANADDQALHHWFLADPDGFRDRLGKVTFVNLVKTLERALAKSGNTLADIDYYIPMHLNTRGHATICEMVGVPLEKAYYLSKYGHVGQLDPLLGMALAESEGKIKKGDLVGLSIMGISYTWCGAAVRW